MFKLKLYLSVKSLKSEFCHFSYCVGQPKVHEQFCLDVPRRILHQGLQEQIRLDLPRGWVYGGIPKLL